MVENIFNFIFSFEFIPKLVGLLSYSAIIAGIGLMAGLILLLIADKLIKLDNLFYILGCIFFVIGVLAFVFICADILVGIMISLVSAIKIVVSDISSLNETSCTIISLFIFLLFNAILDALRSKKDKEIEK